MGKNLNELCEEYNPDIELIGSDNVDDGHTLADMLIKEREINELEKISLLESNLSFIRKVRYYGLDNGVVEDNRKYAIKLIEIYGPYTKLNYKGQKKKAGEKGMSLENCTNYKLYQVLKKMYESALKETNQQIR